MVDFSISQYKILLNALHIQDFLFQTFEEYLDKPCNKAIILRHDVDRFPLRALKTAQIENQLSICGSYYFRIVKESFNPEIINQIEGLGHEVGYHYEDVSLAARRLRAKRITERELAEIAIDSFAKNLEKLRKIVPVKTICMHGSPMNRWDSRLLWEYYDYCNFGIIGEPYFDINFNEVLYLTDTGRRWDGDSVNIRDKTFNCKECKENTKGENPAPRTPHPVPFPRFHSTFDIIRAAEKGELPDKIMMTFHPQRWTGKPVPWVKELVWQNVKNVAKYFIVKMSR